MTIIIAAIREKEAIMGSDSLITSGDKSFTPKQAPKYRKINNFIVGFAGLYNVKQAIDSLVTKQNIYNRQDALTVAISIFKKVKENIDLTPFFRITEESADLLFITKDMIYCVDYTLTVSEHEDFCCIGSGQDVANGYMDALYGDKRRKLENIMTEAMERCEARITTCAGPFCIEEL